MWKEENNNLYRSFEFKDFSEAFAFMTRVALLAENKTIIQPGKIPGTKWKYGCKRMMQEIP